MCRVKTGDSYRAAARCTVPSHLPPVLMLGAVSQISQVLFLRELLMVFHGNELSIGLILAAWLAWVGAGSRLGSFLATRTGHPVAMLALSAAGVMLVLPLTILLIRVLRSFFDVLPGSYLSLADMTVSCFVLMAPACLLLGAQFVLLSRIWRESDRAKDTSGAAKTYVVEAAGNVLGGLLFTFLIVHYLDSFQAAVLAGMLMPAAVLLLTGKPFVYGNLPWLRPAMVALLLLAALAFPFLDNIDQWAYRIQWRHFTPQHQLVETYQSKHGVIAVVQREDQYSFYQSGHLVFSAAGPGAAAPSLEGQEAVQFAHLAMAQHTDPGSILLIGGGLRGTLAEIIKHPVERVDYIELDEVLTKAAGPYLAGETLAALADPRVSTLHTDGRLFVKTAADKYDMIIVDVPDPATAVLNRFYTGEFFSEAAALLNPGGVFVIGAVSTPDLRGLAVANRNAAIYHTLSGVFPRVLPAGERFICYFATDTHGQISVDASILQERFNARNIETDGFSSQHYHTLLQESPLQRVNWVIRNHGRSRDAHLAGPAGAPLFPGSIEEQEFNEKQLPPVEQRYFINSDFRPIGYYYTLMFWDELARMGTGSTFKRLLNVQTWWVLPLCAIPLLAAFGLRLAARQGGWKKRSDLKFAVLLTVFTTGFSTMSLQVALLFSFQSIYGFVYEMVGLIVAFFMAGLALGAFCTNRFVAHKSSVGTLASVQLLIALLAVLIALVLPRAAALQLPPAVFILFSMLTFLAGLINGVDFPLSAACYMSLNNHAEKSTAAVYGVELFGACAGAVIASAVVAPVLGIAACCVLAGIANATSFVVLLISRRPGRCLERTQPPPA